MVVNPTRKSNDYRKQRRHPSRGHRHFTESCKRTARAAEGGRRAQVQALTRTYQDADAMTTVLLCSPVRKPKFRTTSLGRGIWNSMQRKAWAEVRTLWASTGTREAVLHQLFRYEKSESLYAAAIGDVLFDLTTASSSNRLDGFQLTDERRSRLIRWRKRLRGGFRAYTGRFRQDRNPLIRCFWTTTPRIRSSLMRLQPSSALRCNV